MALPTNPRMTGAFSPVGLFRWRQALGLDFHVVVTLLFRGWGILAGGITLVLLPLWLSPAQQGYYYTFASLLALQVFFELGLSQVIIQLVGHEAAHLSFHEDGSIKGAPDRIARLGGIIKLLQRWYAVAAVLFMILGGLAGAIFFDRHGQVLAMSQWAPVWGIAVVLTAINLYFSPQLAFIEGTGQVGQVARLRLIQSMVGYSGLWLLLMTGADLWAAVAVPFVSACATRLWLRARGGWLKTQVADTSLISWRCDVFPLQWRIAVSWACGYFIFSLFTPIVFASHGAAAAGRLGMAMSVFSAVTTLGLSWVNAKTPSFAMHVSRGESAILNHLFRGVAIRSIAITGLMGFMIVGLAALGAYYGVVAAQRIAEPITLFWIATASTVNTAVYAAAVYMRAHREEPMLPVSVVSALLTIVVVMLLRNDVPRMMMGYAAIGGCVSMPWTFLLFRRYRTRHIVPANQRSKTLT